VPAVAITADDLLPFMPDIDQAKAELMITDALALAARVAPCITAEDFAYEAAAKAFIRGAILRWYEAGTGALSAQNAGPFGQSLDTRQTRKGMFWPSEIAGLQELCGAARTSGGAFFIDTSPEVGYLTHAEICALNFGALYCSCGAVLTGDVPLYELP
jgi:hypothetical protein